MMEDIKRRAKNFSVGEIKLLFDLVKEKRNTLERRRAASVPLKDKNKVWEDIENSFNNLSGSFNDLKKNVNYNTSENEFANTESNYSSVLESGQSTHQTKSAPRTSKVNNEQNMLNDKESGLYKQKNAATRNAVEVTPKENILKQNYTSNTLEIRNVLKIQKEDIRANSIELDKKLPTVNPNSATSNKKPFIKTVKEKHSCSTVIDSYKTPDVSSSEEIRNVHCIPKKSEKQSDVDSDGTLPDSDITGKFVKETENEQIQLPSVSSSEEIRKVLCISQKEEKRSDIDSDSTSPDADNPLGVTTRINHYHIIKNMGEPTTNTAKNLENKFKNLISIPQVEEKGFDLEYSTVADRQAPKYANNSVTVLLSEFSPVSGVKNGNAGLSSINQALDPIYKMSEPKESQSKKSSRVNSSEEHSASEFRSLSGFKKKSGEDSKINPNPSNLSSSSTFFLTHNLDKISPRGSFNTLASAKTELVALQKQIHEQQLQFDREEQMLKVREHFLRLEILKLDIRLKQLDIKLKEKNLTTYR